MPWQQGLGYTVVFVVDWFVCRLADRLAAILVRGSVRHISCRLHTATCVLRASMPMALRHSMPRAVHIVLHERKALGQLVV